VANTNEWVRNYRIRNVLHTGVVSQLLEVIEPKSGRHFAMKVLLPETATNPFHRENLFYEASVGMKLAHENVVKVLKVDKDRYEPNFVMEFFPSGSLRRRLLDKDEQFIRENALAIFKKVTTALAYMSASKVGYVHRDLKPDNILVNDMLEVKLIDFAIAKRIPGFFGRMMHKKGKPSGTPSYMSPQQIRDWAPDPRDDIYSLGATMYEMLTFGRPPFRGNTQEDLFNKQLMATPDSPQVFNKDLTDDVSKFLLRMLAKKREDRQRNFHEVRIALNTLRIWKVGSGKK
jgi:serine/threonine protein kinase